MTSRRLAVLIALIAAVAATAAALDQSSSHGANRASVPPPARLRAKASPHPHGLVARRSVARRLSLDQLAGQRIIYAYSGLQPPRSLLATIRAGEAAGVIFFAPNISSLSQIRVVISELQRANASSPVHAPLLLLTDQEGGQVRRIPGAPVLSEAQIGQGRNAVELARQAGAGAGLNLARVGISVNLAPVLDVFRRPGNFIDEFQRSYSANPQTAASLGGAFISAQQRAGVAATAKHFPGLGAAAQNQNTDLGPVSLDLSLDTLRTVDEVPYRAAISAGVKLVMTSWAVYPALDPRLPAGLSPTVIQTELRGRLGFRGVTITDGIDAGALSPFGTVTARGVLAARAGADLLLCAAATVNSNAPAEGLTVLHGIASALRSGRLSAAGAEESVARIMRLRTSFQ